MYKEYQDSLLESLQSLPDLSVESYFGELERPEEGKFAKGSLPIVYIDFTGDDTSNVREPSIDFSLYIVHMSYSKNKSTKIDARNEVFAILKNIYKVLTLKMINNSNPIRLLKLRKIFDANAAGGYLTVYQKDIAITIQNPILTGEI